MPRHCPECKAQMRDDGINCWCVQAYCTFYGYVDLKTGRIDRSEKWASQKNTEKADD